MENILVEFVKRNKLYLFNDNSWDISQDIVDLIYSGNKTIVRWSDGSKTVTSPSDGDKFDPEVGFAMAISQKMFGSRNRFSKFVSASMKKSEQKVINENKKVLNKIAKQKKLN